VGRREKAALVHRRIPRQPRHRLQQHDHGRRLRRELLVARRLVPRQQPPDDRDTERAPHRRQAGQRRGHLEQRHGRQRVLRADRLVRRPQHGRVPGRRMAHQRPHQGRRGHAPREAAHLGLDLEPDLGRHGQQHADRLQQRHLAAERQLHGPVARRHGEFVYRGRPGQADKGFQRVRARQPGPHLHLLRRPAQRRHARTW
jgi:hypothetical protein